MTIATAPNSQQFSIQTLEEAAALARELSAFFPDPASAEYGLSELLVNAVEHGNLAISYEEKPLLIASNQWRTEIDRRLSLAPYASRRVFVEFENHGHHVSVYIRDEGDGFDWQRYVAQQDAASDKTHGRGIYTTLKTCFERLEYLGKGNEVRVSTQVKLS